MTTTPFTPSTDLRIAFWGNIANAHYPTVKVLRAAGVDAHIFVGDTDVAAWRPETDDPSLRAGYPDWIHEGPWIRPHHSVAPWTSPAIEELAGFDYVVVSGNAPAIAQFAEPEMIFYSSGGDLTVRPFPIAFRHMRGSLPKQLGHGVLGLWQRRAIRRASQIWTQPFAPFVDALSRIGVDQDRIADMYFPLIVDTNLFRPDPTEVPAWVAGLAPESDFVVFHPSRLMLDQSPLMMRSGQTKGSGHVLDGFAEFRKSGTVKRPILMLPDVPASNDREHARQRIAELGIEDSVHWAQPPNPEGFSRVEMVHLYNRSDVTINEFGAGWFGWVSLESMSCGVPVISRIDKPVIKGLYGSPGPWVHAQDGKEMALRLADLANDPATRADIGAASRVFIQEHHAFETAGERAVQSVLRATGRSAPAASPKAA